MERPLGAIGNVCVPPGTANGAVAVLTPTYSEVIYKRAFFILHESLALVACSEAASTSPGPADSATSATAAPAEFELDPSTPPADQSSPSTTPPPDSSARATHARLIPALRRSKRVVKKTAPKKRCFPVPCSPAPAQGRGRPRSELKLFQQE